MTLKEITGGVTAAQGFTAGGVYCGIKESSVRKRDIAVIYSEKKANVGGVFTTNQFAAAPVEWCREVVKRGKAQMIVVNSGNANACTGDHGRADVQKMAELAAQYGKVDAAEVLVCSTGVIGHTLPMDKVSGGIISCVAGLSPEGSDWAAEAIATTDTYQKEMAVEYEFDGKTIHVGGIAKGSGMIHPNMATMLCFITTDLQISAEAITAATKTVADDSFNMVTVDGDTSTNDSMLVLANGMAGNQEVTVDGPGYQEFVEALQYVAAALAKMMAHDGEGATKLLECQVCHALTKEDARKVAKAVVSSSLVKAAFFGEDANWGRIICAVGYSGAAIAPEKVDLWLESEGGKIQLMAAGAGLNFDEEAAAKVLKEKSIQIIIDLHQGEAAATSWGCDLTYDYVKINADYRS